MVLATQQLVWYKLAMIQPIILAAGKGTRLKSENPKAIFPLLGKPMIHRVIDALRDIPQTKTSLVVVGYQADKVRSALGPDIQTVEQTELTGSATAVRVCMPHLDPTDAVLIMNADQPLMTRATFQNLTEVFHQNPSALVIATAQVGDFDGWRSPFISYGRIIRSENGAIEKNTEYKVANEAERAITEVNVGLYCVPVSWLAEVITDIKANPVTGEYYLTEIMDLARREGKQIISVSIPPAEALGINSQEDALHAEMVIRREFAIPTTLVEA
jgi:bifunctional UDP-N-acetylglucosamine pyrophosphorylase/glucosamine-1-phosphate N-acetyltransferase